MHPFCDGEKNVQGHIFSADQTYFSIHTLAHYPAPHVSKVSETDCKKCASLNSCVMNEERESWWFVLSTKQNQVVNAMYTSRDEAQRKQINAFMTAFQEHPQSWTRVDTILEKTQCEQSKFFALATLEHCVKYRWERYSPFLFRMS